MEEFDPDKFLAEPEDTNDFDPDAFLAEEEPSEEKEVVSPELPSPELDSAIGRADFKTYEKAAKSADLGGKLEKTVDTLTPKSLGKGVSDKAIDLAAKLKELNLGGRLDRELLESIRNNPELYQQISESEGVVPAEVSKFVKDLEEEKFKATQNMGDVLQKDVTPVKKEEFLSKVEDEMTLQKRTPTQKRLNVEKQAADKVTDVEKSTKKAQKYYSNRLEELKSELEQAKALEAEYKNKSTSPQDLRKMVDQEVKELDRIKDSLDDEIFEYDDATTTKQINREKKLIDRQKRKAKENLKDRLSEIKDSERESKKVADSYKKAQSDIKKEIQELKSSEKKDIARLKDEYKKAQEGAKKAKIKSKPMSKAGTKGFKMIEDITDYTTEITGQDLEEIRKALSERYGEEGGEQAYKAVRKMIVEQSPEAKALLDKSTTATSDIDVLSKQLGLTPTEVTRGGQKRTDYLLPQGEGTAPKRMAGAMSIPKGAEDAPTPKALIEEALKDRPGGRDLLNKLELNRAAQLVDSDLYDMVDAATAAQYGIRNPGAVERALKGAASKGQELLAKASASSAGKLAKGAAKLGFKAAANTLPFVGAYSDLKDIEEMGVENPLLKAAYVGLEQVNPLPVSTLDMYKAMDEQAPMRQAAARRAMASNYGLREEPKKEITIKSLKDPELTQQTVYDLSKIGTGASQEYARRLQGIIDKRSTKEEYDRKLSMLASEPAFRKLMEKLGGSSNDDGNEN